MAGGELYGVWVQTVTNDTTAANVEKYGEIEDMAQAYRDGFAKDFCDGQTSPTPPRWPDDGMQLVYTYDQESARLISEFLREDVAARIAGGDMGAGFVSPSWLSDIAAQGLETAARAAVLDAVTAQAIEEAAPAVMDLTRSQLEARLVDYIAATGNRRPSASELYAWLQRME